MKVHFVLKSSNAKTGPIPVSMTEMSSCPTRCSFKGNGCYAESGPAALHWRKVPERGMDWGEFCSAVAALPEGTLWRHNVAGDLPGNGSRLYIRDLRQLVEANKGRKGFAYSHYSPLLTQNSDLFSEANDSGFTINLSAESLKQADSYADLGIGPVVVVLPADTKENLLTPQGRRVVVCPAVTRDDTTCATCGLCQHAKRETIVGFPAHGSRKRIVSIRVAQ